jgi:hypothetical protein
MKYVMLLMGTLDEARCGAEDDGATMEEFIAFDRELEEAGVLAGGFGLDGPELGTSVTIPAGTDEPLVTAGPYAESREFVGGTIVVDVADIDEAIRWAVRSPGARHGGRVEVRPMLEL